MSQFQQAELQTSLKMLQLYTDTQLSTDIQNANYSDSQKQ